MKHLLITVGAGTLAFYLIDRFVVKDDEAGTGFIAISPGFGLDDLVVGGGTALLAMWASKMVH